MSSQSEVTFYYFPNTVGYAIIKAFPNEWCPESMTTQNANCITLPQLTQKIPENYFLRYFAQRCDFQERSANVKRIPTVLLPRSHEPPT
jgi:hypothetical protein